jgi:hypothetical protein
MSKGGAGSSTSYVRQRVGKEKHSHQETPGPDADFGMAPSFVPGSRSTPYGKDTLVVGQKNGNL